MKLMERCDVCEYCGESIYYNYLTMGKHDVDKCRYKKLIALAWDAAIFAHTHSLATTNDENERMKQKFLKNNGVA